MLYGKVHILIVLLFYVITCQSRKIVIETSAAKRYNFFPLLHDYLEVDVRGKGYFHILLSETYCFSPKYYEIVYQVGQNTSLLRRDDSSNDVVSITAPTIQNENVFQKYWVLLDRKLGTIYTGIVPNKNPLMVYTDPDPFNATYFGLSTCCETVGTWHIDHKFLIVENERVIAQKQITKQVSQVESSTKIED